MVRMRQVVATTYDRDSRIEDDSDVREPEFYNKQLLVDFDPKFITSAYQLDKADFPFGFEFLRKVAFREINFGQKQANVEEINIAGKPMPKIGFVLCRECGKVHNVREKFEHAISCRYRNSKSDKTIQDCLYLYREFSSEAIRILLPVLSLTEDQRLHSFVAALYLGLKKKFGGNIDHLRTAIHEEPIPDSGLRKKYLVLYDVVPGGTGYLKELMRPPQPLMEVFQLAREVLRSCECGQSPDKDGCYRCLYIYRRAMTGQISRGKSRWISSESCWMANQPSRRPTPSATSPSTPCWKASWRHASSKRSAVRNIRNKRSSSSPTWSMASLVGG
jgi:DEAD/DEAH box helicase domain-containing protein